MTTLAEFMIIADVDNRPPMLEKSIYDSWKSRIELYIKNKKNERMILNSVLNGPLVWPTIAQEDGTTRLPPDVYAIVNHHKVSKDIWDRVKLLMLGMKLSLQERKCKLYIEFDKFSFVKGGQVWLVKCYYCQGEGHMAKKCTQPKRPRNAAWFKDKAMLAEAQDSDQILDEEQLTFLANPGIQDGQAA
uniref:Integrase, catalytic region, zinc finger, CCHC-type, peptidase aspartic, catalytic n=1 Tax=Tanacetum cinerariifolium TaxID=118510 RepID=A0A6L2J1Q3_TANCI|nr:integrase, catalytic region, zinc finger, CCHC-type, peptidase aspartic, catalytic [Tanacetum cinerariifolium]